MFSIPPEANLTNGVKDKAPFQQASSYKDHIYSSTTAVPHKYYSTAVYFVWYCTAVYVS